MTTILRRNSGARVELSDFVMAKLHHHRQLNSGDAEAGGVLLGRYIVGSEDVVFDDATISDAEDVRADLGSS